jgi:ribosome maturation factor RimP
MSRSDEALVRSLSPLCDTIGVGLYDVELATGTLTVTVEADGGLDLEALSEVARQVSAFLDDHDELTPKGRYELEVGTPGLERRLRTPEHLARAVGERVSVRLRPGVEGARRLEGLLASFDADRLVVRLDDGTEVAVGLGDLERARTVFDWRRAFADDKQGRRAGQGANEDTRRKVARP